MSKQKIVSLFLLAALIIAQILPVTQNVPAVQAATPQRTDAVVLVNSTSASYTDFQRLVKPYLDNLGIPYTTLDIATTAVTNTIGNYAVIIVGHRSLDVTGANLDSTEQGNLTAAVQAGSGLVNFDNDLAANRSPRYTYIQTIFNFGYVSTLTGNNITFGSTAHYITERHTSGEVVTTGTMNLAGISLPASGVTGLAAVGTQPFLAAAAYGSGRAVQWNSYDWMSHAVKGPLSGPDDLVWRSIVWAARKPFVLQGRPPFVTYRVDDVNGPMTWLTTAVESGFKPWAGLFINELNAADTATISTITNSGKATASVHAFATDNANFTNFFYFDHVNQTNLPDSTVSQNFSTATAWHTSHNVPISKVVVGHYYEFGDNVFGGLKNWGVQFITTMMNPGGSERSSNWMMAGPYRLYETGPARDMGHNVSYSDFMQIPNHPELNNQFFNCVTEIRDADPRTNYEWDPTPTISDSVKYGTEYITRSLDSMVMATLFSHEYLFDDVTADQFRSIYQGITANLAPYNPIYVTLDDACQYERAIKTSDITASTYDATTDQVSVTVSGQTDVATKFHVFSQQGANIVDTMVDVPVFNGSTLVNYKIPGALDHVVVTPNPGQVVAGGTVQFTAQGFDVVNTPIPNLNFTWNAASGGTIDSSGLFTAGLTVGTFANAVSATTSGVTGTATVNVTNTTLHHFSFDAIPSPQYAGIGFQITIRARDVNNNPVASYNGTAALSTSLGAITPTTAAFTNGVWSGLVTLNQTGNGVTLTATDSTFTGTSASFNVATLKACPCTIWANSATPSIADTSDGVPIEVGVKFRSEVNGYITGLRFYKGPLNTGTHTGHLWKTDGTLLASVTFSGETPSGWQQMLFQNPVAITANTTYVASYYSPTGNFADTPDYFHTATVNSPLRGLADGEDGPNGVYNYGALGFPTATWVGHAPNYWMDVVFSTTSGQVDTTPPTVTGNTPANAATGVATTIAPTATFSEALDPATINASTFTLKDAANNPVAAAVSYNTGNFTATLTPQASLAFSTTYTATLKGGATGIADPAGNRMAADFTWSFTTAATPPTLHHFSFDAIASPQYVSTPFAVTIRAMDASNNPVTSYNGTAALSASAGAISPLTAVFASGVWTGQVTLNQAGSAITITATDGTVTGTSGAINVTAMRACPCSVWDNATIPAIADTTDNTPIALGFKFRSSTDGYITGLRFYKGPQNTGTHTGHLWRLDGTLLGTLTFTNETGSGWQQTLFQNPIAITANTTYVASYFSPTGYFASSAEYFHNAINNPPLTALAEGTDGFNGVYNYTTDAFPASSWAGHAPNYWVDVVFNTASGTVDTTPPVVTSTIPASAGTGVAITSNANAVFSEALDPATVSASTFTLKDSANNPVAGAVSYDPTFYMTVFDPTASLAYSTTYTATVKGGATGVADLAGNRMAADYSWTFTTGAPPPPPPDQGPGGPILVVGTSTNLFSRYYSEILRAEGLNAFAVADISSVSATTLAAYKVVILGEMPLTAAQVTMFSDWVNAGGNLIAMRPAKALASLLGLTDQATTLSNAYLLMNTASGPASGLVNQTIQFHGTADRYALNGATAVATLYSNATTATTAPAVTLRSVGTSGGQAAAFTYDLARSIVYTRQGNPAWASDERDGIQPLRSDDMYYGAKSGNVQPDWIDLSKVAIPQADEQQRLLANMIVSMSLDQIPLPRFWYFPRNYKAVVVMTGDDHNQNGTAPRFDTYKLESPANCSVANWECVRATSYIYMLSSITDAQAAAYNAQGFEIALHVNTGCANWDQATLTTYFTNQLAEFQAKYPSLPMPVTERTHCIAWSDWATHPKVSLAKGIRLDTNYYYWPPAWVNNVPGMFTGSGMPMRFADLDGTMLDVYQATTQMTDESGQSYPFTIDTLLNRATGPEGYYGVFTANFHTDYASHPSSNATVTSAQQHGVPVVAARQMLQWLDGRNSSSFQNLAWDGAHLTFSVSIGSGANGLKVMLPAQSATQPLSAVTLNGAPVTYTAETIKGVNYATFLAGIGTYQATYGTTPVNRAPVAVNDSYTTSQNTALNIAAPGVLGNDSDPDGDPLTAAVGTAPAHGTLTLNANGSFSYTPASNYTGSDSFTYTASDGKGGTASATVSITITGVNTAPVANNQSVTTNEDVAAGITLTGSDADGDPLTFSVVASPLHGTLSGTSPNLTYTPALNYFGSDSFTFKANDGKVDSNTATVSITINAVNDPPVASAQSVTTKDSTPVAITLVATDVDSPSLTYSLVTQPVNGAVTGTPPNVTYTPTAGYTGSDQFSFKANDGLVDSNVAVVSITVTAANVAPTLSPIGNKTVNEQTLLTFTAAATDPDSTVLTFSLVNAPAGAAINASSGVFTWTPTEAQGPGAYTFTVTVTDNGSPVKSASETITVTVNEVNLAPVLAAIPNQSVPWGAPVTFTAAGTDTDTPANTLAYSLSGAPSGAAINPATGAFSWTPSSSQTGAFTFTVTVTDNGTPALSASQTTTITVAARATTLTYNLPLAAQYTDTAALTATLNDASGPVAGKTVNFTLGTQTTSAVTGTNGVATAALQISQAAGNYNLSASFAGDAAYAGSSTTQAFQVNAENAYLAYSGSYIATTGTNATVRVNAYDSAAAGYAGAQPETSGGTIGAITNMYITFNLYPAASCNSGTPATTRIIRVSDTGTNGDGIGSASFNFRTSTETTYCVVAKLTSSTGATNSWYAADLADIAGQVYYTNTGRMAAGGGSITDPGGTVGNFGFNTRVTSNVASGSFLYTYSGSYNGTPADFIISSGAVSSATYSGTTYPMTVTLQGTATITILRASDGALLSTTSGATFTAAVTDSNQTSGVGTDTLQLTVNSGGQVFKSVATTAIGAGNIRTRSQ